MKLKRITLTICFVLFFLLPFAKYSLANTVSPYKTEILISNQERTKNQVTFVNDGLKDINITPVPYSYDPKNTEIRDTQGEIFLRLDREIFSIASEESFTFDFEIVPFQNMEPGTYFNLILFEQEPEDIFTQEQTPVGVLDTLSHLVVLHIADSESSIFGISTDFAQISIDVKNRGIPFIQPMKVKYSYQNITNYVLNPMGEIQIFNEDSKHPPTYIKINESEEKLYPGDIMEEEFEIKSSNLADFFATRRVIGRFYNGIDENFVIRETEQSPNYIIPVITGIVILLTIILLKSFMEGKKHNKKSK